MAEGAVIILEVITQLSGKQSRKYFVRTVRKKHSNVLKKMMVAQITTTKQSGITIPQKYRRMSTFQRKLDWMRRMNTGVCKYNIKSFGEVIQKFIYGRDET